MRISPPSRITSEAGSALVEFALMVPLFFLMVFGLVELGIIFAGYCCATYASQVAVRYAVVHGYNSASPATNAGLTSMVKPYLWAAQRNGSSVITTWNPDNTAGSTVTVSISLTYQTGIPYSSLNTVNVGAFAQGTILY